MDPNAALAQIRATVEAMASDQCTADHRALLAVDLAAAWDGLDGWLSRGGYLPEAWRAPAAARILRRIVTGNPDPLLRPEDG